MEGANGAISCSICRRKYVDKVNLRAHMRRSHSRGAGLRHQKVDDGYVQQQAVNNVARNAQKPGTVRDQGAAQVQDESEVFDGYRDENIDEFVTRLSGNSAEMPHALGAEAVHNEELSASQPTDNDDGADWFKKNWNLSREVLKFFQSYSDTSETLYPKLSKLSPLPNELNKSSRDLLSFCMRLQLTLGEAKAFFDLIRVIEEMVPADYRFVSSTFLSAESFASYLDKLRKWRVREEGWKIAVINTSFGSNRRGGYRSVLSLLLETIRKAGGSSAIQPFKEVLSGNERCFSNPCDSESMGQYERNHRLQGKIVGVDIYSDGTILAKSGSQSANCVRVRVVNVKGYSNTWHDVGITPTIDSGDQMKSDHEKRRERCQVFQRFIFLLLQDFISASHNGVTFHGEVILPRVVMLVADQPQERAFYCLKGSDSYADCSLCLMPTRLKVDRVTTVQGKKRRREGSEERNEEFVEQPRDISSMRQMVFQQQTANTPAEMRNVRETVMAQVLFVDANTASKWGRQKTVLMAVMCNIMIVMNTWLYVTTVGMCS